MDRERSRIAVLRHADVGLAIALAALGECELFFRSLRSDWPGPRAVNAVVVVVIAFPALWRRRAPLAFRIELTVAAGG